MRNTVGLIFILFWFASSPAHATQVTLREISATRNSPQRNAHLPAIDELILRVQQLLQQGDLSGARGLLERPLQLFPNNSGLLNLLGIIEAQQGHYPAAENAFRRAVLYSPKFVNAWLNLGRLYQENQRTDIGATRKAIEVYRRILKLQPENAEAHYQSAVLLVSQRQYRQSLDHLSQLPAKLQTSTQALAMRLASQVGLNEKLEASKTVGQLLTHADLSEPDVLAVLPALAANRRDDVSVRLLEEINRRGKSSANSLQQLALIYERQDKLDQARALLEKSAAVNPQLTPLLVELARIARKQKDYQGALGYLAHARDIEPDNAKIHYLFGLICLDSSLLAESHQAFSRALVLKPNEPVYNYAMGLVAAYRNDPLEAIPYLEKYRRLKPSDPRGKLALGIAYYNHKDFAAALQPLREATESSETSSIAHYHLGSIARQEGRLAEAFKELTEALRTNPQSIDALAELGQCHLQKKNYKTAQEFLDRAVAADPTHYFANFGLLLLYSRTKDPREKAQAEHFESIKEKRYERARALLRTIEVQPPGT